MTVPSGLVLRESLVSAAINVVLSALFFLAMFHGRDSVPVWGAGNLAFDGLPQGFMVGLMGTLIPSLLVRRRFALGAGTGGIVGRAVVVGLVGAALVSGLTALLAAAFAVASVPFIVAMTLKTVAGASLGAAATLFALNRLLRPGAGQ